MNNIVIPTFGLDIRNAAIDSAGSTSGAART